MSAPRGPRSAIAGVLAVAWIAGAASCAPTVSARLSATAFTAPDSLSREIAALLDQANVPGAAVAVVAGGGLAWSRGFGYADVERRTPMTDSTVLQVASVSKAVSAWGVMRLAESGRISLDTPIDSLVKRWHLPPSRFDARRVTLRRLLSHTAGLTSNPYRGYGSDAEVPALVESLAGRNDGVGDVHIAFEPGTKWAYSEGGYTLMQLMIEDITGEPFARYMRATVLEPLGMRASAYEWTPALRARTATPYNRRGRAMPVHRFIEEAPDGLYTTAADLARWIAATMPGARGEPVGRGVLSRETISQMLTPQPATGDSPWGLGYWMWPKAGGTFAIGHGGTNPGYRARVIAYPSLGVALVVLTNSDNGDRLIGPLVCAWSRWAAGASREEC
ncbi:MAG: serine hydrolase domain-containing protein [Gemmatimonadaceae bacterium]